MDILNINENDLDDIENCGHLSLPIYYKKNELNILINEKNYLLYKILKNKEIAGFVICELYGSKRIHIMSIAILPKYRRLNLGTKLIEFLKNEYKGNIITLNVQQNNINAIHFYIKNNFSVISELKNYYNNLEFKDAYQMAFN